MFVDLKCQDCGTEWTSAADDEQNISHLSIDNPYCPICGSDEIKIIKKHTPDDEPKFDTGCTYDDGPSGKNRKW
jgi:hypothetical protein